jgi:predicted ArsR family transcriptional regulator
MRQPDSALTSYYNPAQQPRRKLQRERILDYLETHGASTLKEIACGLSIPDSTVSARLNELRPEKLNVCGERRCRINGLRKQIWFFRDRQRALFGGGVH